MPSLTCIGVVDLSGRQCTAIYNSQPWRPAVCRLCATLSTERCDAALLWPRAGVSHHCRCNCARSTHWGALIDGPGGHGKTALAVATGGEKAATRPFGGAPQPHASDSPWHSPGTGVPSPPQSLPFFVA